MPEYFLMNCPNCGRRVTAGLIYECRYCTKVFCIEGGPRPGSEGCVLGANEACPHCKRLGVSNGDNCFDDRKIRRRHGTFGWFFKLFVSRPW